MMVRTVGNFRPWKAFLIAVVICEWACTIWIVWRFGSAARQLANAGRIVADWYRVRDTVTILNKSKQQS